MLRTGSKAGPQQCPRVYGYNIVVGFRAGRKTPKLGRMAEGKYLGILVPAAFVASLVSAAAQTGGNFDVKTMNFDMWCQEQAHLPPARCDQRTPEDEKTFEAYRDKVERYEIPYLQQKQNELMLDRDILHNDPVSHPLSQDPQAQQQSPTERPQTPSP